VLVACLPLGITGVADAKPKPRPKLITRTSSTSASGRGSIATTTAICPKKTRATGGGYLEGPIDSVNNPTDTPFVFESQKVDQRSWRASAQADGPTVSGPSVSITVFVYCQQDAPATTAASATVPTPGVSQFGPIATATCPSGKVLAGGFSTPPPIANPATSSALSNAVISSRASGIRGWQVGVRSSLASSVTSYAYCANHRHSLLEAPGANSTVFLGNIVPAVGTCPGKLKALSGGFSAETGSLNGVFEVYESHRYEPEAVTTNNHWSASGRLVGPPSGTMNAFAYCG
jgi:hypothetical protein